MILLVTCDVCHAQLELSKPDVVAAAEVATFADVHGEHAAWSIRVLVRGAAEDGFQVPTEAASRRPRG